MRRACKIVLTEEERPALERMAKSRRTEVRVMMRAKIVLAAAQGKQNKDIAREMGIMPTTVGLWRSRFAEKRLPGILKDAPRGGRPPTRREQFARRIVETTTQTKPGNATHWSCRTLAERLGTNPTMVSRVWRANGLKPHRIRTFKLSNDPRSTEKLGDVVGLYLNPPGACLGALCRREEPDSGPGPDAAKPSDVSGPLRDPDARLQTPRNDDLVCGAGTGRRAVDRNLHGPPPASREACLPAAYRRENARRTEPAPDPG